MKVVSSLPLPIALLISTLVLSACQSQPQIKQMQDQNRLLAADLERANNSVAQLQQQETELRQQLAENTRVMDVLGTEKSVRVQESSELRSQVRRFVQHQIDAYKDFLVQGGLLDYVGGELVERANIEEKPLFVVDLANAIPSSGTLTGVGAHFVRPGNFSVKVLRKIDDNLVVIWDSKPLQVHQPGINRINFPVSVGVEAGDVIGYYFTDGVAISFDEGTGDSRFQSTDLTLGAIVRINSLAGEKRRRAYSLGVYGLLN
jgi:hypothetical protein